MFFRIFSNEKKNATNVKENLFINSIYEINK